MLLEIAQDLFSVIFPNDSSRGNAVQEPPPNGWSKSMWELERICLFCCLLWRNTPSVWMGLPNPESSLYDPCAPRLSGDILLRRLFLGCEDPSIPSPWSPPHLMASGQTVPLSCLQIPVAQTLGAFLVIVCEVRLTDPLGILNAVTSTLMGSHLESLRSQERVTLGQDALLSGWHSPMTK